MCKYTDGTIVRMSNDQIGRNLGLTNLLAGLDQATRAVSRAKTEVAANRSQDQAASRSNLQYINHHQEQQQLGSKHHSHHHHAGESSTEEEHSVGDSAGGGHPGQTRSSIATRVRRKRHSRETSQPEPSQEHHSTVQHHYHDLVGAAPVKTCVDGSNESKKSKGGIAFPFPSVLHAMLERADHEGFNDVVSWQPHGRAFTVHSPNRFVSEVMPLFFRQTRFASFQRQLSLYGFLRLTRKGPDHGAYYHELFVRGRPDLCHLMQRTRVKGSWVRQSSSPETEPDFASMPRAPMSSGKAIPKLPPLRNTASSTQIDAEKPIRDSRADTSKSTVTGVATPAKFAILPQNSSNSTYHSTTGFGWTNSSLQATMPSDPSRMIEPSTMVSLNLPNKPFASPRHQSDTFQLPMQQYFEPPPEQLNLAAFLFDVGLDSDDELKAELSQYDTEPLPWNSPSNQTDV